MNILPLSHNKIATSLHWFNSFEPWINPWVEPELVVVKVLQHFISDSSYQDTTDKMNSHILQCTRYQYHYHDMAILIYSHSHKLHLSPIDYQYCCLHLLHLKLVYPFGHPIRSIFFQLLFIRSLHPFLTLCDKASPLVNYIFVLSINCQLGIQPFTSTDNSNADKVLQR